MPLGRRDSRTANRDGISAISSPFDDFSDLQRKFTDVGLDDSTYLVALSGNLGIIDENLEHYRIPGSHIGMFM